MPIRQNLLWSWPTDYTQKGDLSIPKLRLGPYRLTSFEFQSLMILQGSNVATFVVRNEAICCGSTYPSLQSPPPPSVFGNQLSSRRPHIWHHLQWPWPTDYTQKGDLSIAKLRLGPYRLTSIEFQSPMILQGSNVATFVVRNEAICCGNEYPSQQSPPPPSVFGNQLSSRRPHIWHHLQWPWSIDYTQKGDLSIAKLRLEPYRLTSIEFQSPMILQGSNIATFVVRNEAICCGNEYPSLQSPPPPSVFGNQLSSRRLHVRCHL